MEAVDSEDSVGEDLEAHAKRRGKEGKWCEVVSGIEEVRLQFLRSRLCAFSVVRLIPVPKDSSIW
jgi:hypothetical protein